MTIFSKIFGKTREIQDKKHQIWVKWFTEEIPRQSSLLLQYPQLNELVQSIPERNYTKQQINQDREVSDEEFFVLLFGLSQNIPPQFEQLTQICSNMQQFKPNVDKVYKILAPYIFQCHILFTHKFPQLFSRAIKGEPVSQSNLLTLTHLYQIVLQMPTQYQYDIFFLLSPVYQILNDTFDHEGTILNSGFTISYLSEILKPTLNYATSSSEIANSRVPLYKFISNYARFWINQYIGPQFESQQLSDIILIINSVMRIPESAIKILSGTFLKSIFDNAMNLMSFIFLNTEPKNENEKIFELGESILKFMAFVATLGPEREESLWRHPMLHFVTAFSAWLLDKNPLLKWEVTTEFDDDELALLSPEFRNNLPQITIPVYEFIKEETFDSPVAVSQQTSAVHDENQALQYEFLALHEYINSNQRAKKLCELLKKLTEFPHSVDFLKTFISSSLEMSVQFTNKGLYSEQLRCHPRQLAASLTFLTVQFLLSCDLKLVADALESISGYQGLLNSYAFQQQHNLWSLKSDAVDLGFFCLLRNSIYQLLANIFLKVPSHASDVLNAVKQMVLFSSPQMVDESIKFMTILFRTNPNNFINAMARTTLESTLVVYQIRNQTLTIEMIQKHQFEQFINYLGQSRIQTFLFTDLLLRVDAARYFLFGFSDFVSLIFHFLFEPMAQSFALDLLRRGLSLDSGSFDPKSSTTPFDLIFPLLQSLIKTSYDHLNEKDWFDLMIKIFIVLRDTFSINRKSILSSTERYNYMEDAAATTKRIEGISDRITMVNRVLESFIPLTQANPQMQRILAQEPMRSIQFAIANQSFGKETINIMLQLLFEQPVSISNFPKNLEIRNQKLLPYIHEVTKHLRQHAQIFSYIAKICQPSVTNKLRVYQSKLPTSILQYISGFPEAVLITKQQQESINSLLKVFSAVSSFVFKWKTLYESIKTVRTIDGSRPWWTALLISSFTNILSEISHESPSSFMYFDGRHSGLDLPDFPCNQISKAFSFSIMFELSAVFGLPHTKPRLLSLATTGDQKLELLFDGRKLVFEFCGSNRSKHFSKTINYDFKSHKWYRLVVTCLNKTVSVYVDGALLSTFEARSLKFDGEFKNGRIGNISFGRIATSEAPLIFNMSCAYMFSIALTPEVVKAMAELPNDYMYGFSPANISLFPGIDPIIFDDTVDSALIMSYNARMTLENTCANVARSRIGNAIVHGQVMPFSTSFCDVTLNVGGLKIFLPLFEQVDLPVLHEERNGSSFFLNGLIGLFSRFCVSSDLIQSDFIQGDGMRCIAHLLSKLDPQTINKSTIQQLVELYKELMCDEHLTRMIEDIWLNTYLWSQQTPVTRICVFEHLYPDIFEKHSNLLMKSSSAWRIMMLLVGEKDSGIRKAIWDFFKVFAEMRFTRDDQDAFFGFCFSKQGGDLELESLTMFYDLISRKVHDFHRIIESRDYFHPFISLLSSDVEDVRVFGVRFMILLRDFELQGIIQFSKDAFVQSCLSGIAAFNPFNNTNKIWSMMVSFFFENVMYATAMLPLVSAIACNYDTSVVQAFADEFCSQIEQPHSNKKFDFMDAIVKCKLWYFWIFNLMIQTAPSKFNFNDDSEFIKLYSILLTYIVSCNSKSAFQEVIGFFYFLSITNRWNTTPFLRKILCSFLIMFIESPIEAQKTYVFSEIFSYLFYIPDTEIFSDNISLAHLHNNEPPQSYADEIDGHVDYSALLAPLLNEVRSSNVAFSARISPKKGNLNCWEDIELAKLLAEASSSFNSRYEIQMRFLPKKTSFAELFSFLLSFIVRCDPDYVPTAIKLITPFLSSTQVEVGHPTFTHISIALVRISPTVRSEIGNEINQFLNKFRGFASKNAANGDPLTDVQFLAKLFENTHDSAAYLLQTLTEKAVTQSEMNKTTLDAVYKDAKVVKQGISVLRLRPVITNLFNEKLTEFTQISKRQRLLCEKSYKRIFRGLSSNGPWASSNKARHWKVSKHLDSKFRRVFLRPNLDFDVHMRASLLRDEPTAASAQAKYERWLDAQDIVENNKVDEDVDDEEPQKVFTMMTEAQLISMSTAYDGKFLMNSSEIYFDGEQEKSVSFLLSDIEMVLHRSYLHIDSGLEFFLTSHRSFFLFFGKGGRERILRFLKQLSLPKLKTLQMGSSKDLVEAVTQEWSRGQMSNYEYLMRLNLFAGRSFNDLSQYPVFPWVLKNYTSETLDLQDPSNYRDFSKPVGTFHEKRLSKLIDNYELCPDELPEKCLYRFHYSNPFYVVHYLVRVEPFTTTHIELQDQKFDKPNRLFWSIAKSFDAVNSNSPDFRELIPEFFTLPEMFLNENGFDLGINVDTESKINDVVLPPWAHSAAEFVQIHREALESEYVSDHINEWIDLIFGYKQTGQAAIEARNNFHPYCYQRAVTREVLNDPDMLKRIQIHASNTGIIPRQLFTAPHPKRASKPRMPEFGQKKVFKKLTSFEGPICFAHAEGDRLYALGNQSEFYVFNLSRFKSEAVEELPKPQMMNQLNKYVFIPEWTGKNEGKSFAFLPNGRFIASSLWDSSFHVFAVDGGIPSYAFTQRQKFALISSLVPAGQSLLLTSWRDSSMTLWDLKDDREPLYRVTPHLNSLVDFAVDSSLDLIASCDKARNVILSTLSTGRYIRTFTVSGDDTLTRIMLLSAGYIVVCGESAGGNGYVTTVRVFGLNTALLTERTFSARIGCWSPLELASGHEMVAVALDSGDFICLSLPQLDDALTSRCKARFRSLQFHEPAQAIFATDSQGNVFYMDLE